MKTLFITAGGMNWASSRMRAYWVAPYLPGADVMTSAEFDRTPTGNYDAYIFQKFFNQVAAADLRASGKQVYWDICDPVWWWQPADVCGILANVDGVVCSSEALADDLHFWAREQGVKCSPDVIPDRLELSAFPIQHDHSKQSQVTRFIWYGMAANRIGIYAAIDNLHRLRANGHNLSLTIFDDRPDIQLDLGHIPVYHSKWSLENENRVIAEHDIALTPPYPGAWGKVKSNNRTLTALACGIPAIPGDDYTELVNAVRYPSRVIFPNGYCVEDSAKQWQQLLNPS